jgi:hypothetical protein
VGVQLPGVEDWVVYPLTIAGSEDVRVVIAQDQKIRLLVRDHQGVPVPGVSFLLSGRGGDSLNLKTDEAGRAEATAQPGMAYSLNILESGWTILQLIRENVEVRPEEFDIKIVRSRDLECSLESDGFATPATSLVACFGHSSPDPISVTIWNARRPQLSINEAVNRVVFLAVGCLPAESQIFMGTSGSPNAIRIELTRGPTVSVSRTVLPKDYSGPLKATATALKIAEAILGELSNRRAFMRSYSSEFTPSEGDILFGPFTPGTYKLKILDADGKVLWEETREVKGP